MKKLKIDKIIGLVFKDVDRNELLNITSSINDKTDCIKGNRLSDVESMNHFWKQSEQILKEDMEYEERDKSN